jgi:hypothetical protein
MSDPDLFSFQILRDYKRYHFSHNVLLRVLDLFSDDESQKRLVDIMEEERDIMMLQQAHRSFMERESE